MRDAEPPPPVSEGGWHGIVLRLLSNKMAHEELAWLALSVFCRCVHCGDVVTSRALSMKGAQRRGVFDFLFHPTVVPLNGADAEIRYTVVVFEKVGPCSHS